MISLIGTPTDLIQRFYFVIIIRQDVKCLKKHVSLIINVFSMHDVLLKIPSHM